MFTHYFKIALRNLRKQKMYSLINISGLAVGMACVLLISLYVEEEVAYDRFHTKADRIFRVLKTFDPTPPDWPGTPIPLAPTLQDRFSEIERYVRIDPFGFNPKLLIAYGDKKFYEERFILADPSFFEVFSFTLLKGNPRGVLANPTDVVLTRSMAEKYFGQEDPIGKVLLFDDRIEMTVSGIVDDIPRNSHLQFDFVGSFEHIGPYHGYSRFDINQTWGMNNFYTYFLLSEGADARALEAKAGPLLRELRQREHASVILQPITDIHLRSRVARDPLATGSISRLYLYSTIAIMILLIACINFMSLYTANSEIRAKEVGMRKVVGARKNQIIWQFLGEPIILSVLALPLAVLLIRIVLPSFNHMFNTALSFHLHDFIHQLGRLLLLVIIVGFLSGLYPAFFISSFKPIRLFRSKLRTSEDGFTFRNILVVFQFLVAVVLIVGALVIKDQMRYIMDTDLGYDASHIINIPMYKTGTIEKYNLYRNQIITHPDVMDVTATSFTPSIERWREGSYFEGRLPDDDLSFFRMSGDYNLIDLFKMQIVAGRSFRRDNPIDLGKAYILNESAVRSIGWSNQEAVGKRFGSENSRVIGVVKDFYFRSFRRETQPLAINVLPRMFRYASVRVNPSQIQNILQFLESKWQEVNPGLPFDYYFYDDDFANLYKNDLNTKTLVIHFTYLAVFIACLGLFGLSLLTIQRRTKEIGIRKVLGAQFFDTSSILVTGFLRLVGIAYVLAVPMAYWSMNRWLEGFVYRTRLNPWLFVISGIFIVFITLATISLHVIRVTRTNPAEVLKYE